MAETTDTKPPSTGDRFFAWMRSLGVRREPGWIGGVSAGVAVRLGIDPLIVRGILVVIAILGGPALLVYAAAWLLLPDSNDKIHLEQLIAGKYESAIAGIGAMVLLALLPLSQGFWYAGAGFWGEPNWGAGFGRAIWTLAILAAAVALVIWIARRGNPAPSTRPAPPTAPASGAPTEEFAAWRSQQASWKAENDSFRREEAAAKAAAWHTQHLADRQEQARLREQRAAEYRRGNPHPLFSLVVIGLALIAGGLTWLTVGGGELEFAAIVGGAAVTLGVLGLGVIANGVRGKRSGGAGGLAGFIIFPLVFFTLVAQVSSVEFGDGGRFAPVDGGSRLPDTYFVGAGDTELDLTDYYDTGNDGNGTDRVYVLAGSSDVEVLLPEGHSVLVEAHIGAGGVYLVDEDGDRQPFGDNDYLRDEDGDPDLEVRIYVGEGSVTIIEPQSEESK